MWGGLEFNNWVESLPWQEASIETITWVEASMTKQINTLGLWFTYKLSSNEYQDEFTIQIWNIRWNESEEIVFTGTTWESLKAVNNYIISRIKDTNTWESISLEDMPWYTSWEAEELQNIINEAIGSVKLSH